MQTISTTIWPLTGSEYSIYIYRPKTYNTERSELRGDIRLRSCPSHTRRAYPDPVFFRLMWHNGSHQKCYVRISRFPFKLSPVTLRCTTQSYTRYLARTPQTSRSTISVIVSFTFNRIFGHRRSVVRSPLIH